MDALELVAHPARMRIVHALRGGRTLTTAELCTRLPGVSKAMVYRHVEALAAAGILEVARERRVRGAVERHYRLRADRAAIGAEAAATATTEDHRRIFVTAMTVLIAEFGSYLDRENADPAADLVGYRQHALWLDRAELEQLIVDLRRVIVPRMAHEPAPGRGRYLLSPILFPVEQPPRAEQDARSGAQDGGENVDEVVGVGGVEVSAADQEPVVEGAVE
ncbi:helix-turn-helix domain-containing protein [Nocardia blacklockiae]|uniref:helix-turn-helix domain-containing protein n=1 Tax=Nocardia blacklockiae TaxID=480036 RepID=UPI0018945110|nr:helix-turn-helix domain-containing protein [Nocardia blacklockiae]MBF6170843.1 helix-turn-helix domain-containing protein [Nocardia blacklockiae]